MTLRELYNDAKKGPTPAAAFIQEVMAVEITVRRWIDGRIKYKQYKDK